MTRPRVGLVCPYSLDVPGGVQNHVLGFAGHLLRRGYDVQVLAPGRVDAPRIAAAGFVAERVTSAGPAVPVPYNGSVARVNFGPRSSGRVRRWLGRHDFDLLHVHEPVTPSIALLALRAATCPVVATFHTATPRSRAMALAGTVLRRTIDKIAAGIAVSATARDVVATHLHRDPQVIPNGFDHAAFRRGPEAGPDAGRAVRSREPGAGAAPRIAFLGRLDERRKGLDVLLDALPAVRAQVGEVELLVAGGGAGRGAGRRARREAERSGFRLLGPVSDRDRLQLLRSSDVFVAPHRARESFGIVVIEAMTAGATVVAADIPAFTDLLGGSGRDGELGFAFAAEDPAALATGVVRALAADRAAITTRAAAATARYDWTVVGDAVTAVYRSVLARSATADPTAAVQPSEAVPPTGLSPRVPVHLPG